MSGDLSLEEILSKVFGEEQSVLTDGLFVYAAALKVRPSRMLQKAGRSIKLAKVSALTAKDNKKVEVWVDTSSCFMGYMWDVVPTEEANKAELLH